MHPTFFGQRPLFGIHHPPARTTGGARHGILICPPLGHEQTRCHRAIRVLAQALARAGHHALRFDYRGLGDSWGEPADGGVEPWCEDIELALRELAVRSGAGQVSLVGLRVGGALALATLARELRGCPVPQRVILWDPVLTGAEFLRVATQLESEFINDPVRFPSLANRRLATARRQPGEQLLGYAYPPALRASLENLDLGKVELWPSLPTAIVLSRPSVDLESLTARLCSEGRQVDCQTVLGVDGAWEDYKEHELTLRSGRLVPAIVSKLASEVG